MQVVLQCLPFRGCHTPQVACSVYEAFAGNYAGEDYVGMTAGFVKVECVVYFGEEIEVGSGVFNCHVVGHIYCGMVI